jgi:hypothetical protein
VVRVYNPSIWEAESTRFEGRLGYLVRPWLKTSKKLINIKIKTITRNQKK